MAQRTSNHISRRQASNSRPAILLAAARGTPLNQFVTINFTVQEMADEGAIAAALGRIRLRYSRWAKQPGVRSGGVPFDAAMVWNLENTGHWAAHLLIHVPPARLGHFKRAIRGWIEKESGRPVEAGALDVRAVDNVYGLRKYMLKGLDPAFCPLYRIEHVPQGAVRGKRFGYTQNLGPTACRRHGTKKPYRWPARRASALPVGSTTHA